MKVNVIVGIEGEQISLTDFYDALESHDWYHGYSNDPKVVEEGVKFYQELMKRSEQSPAHAELFANYRDHMCSGKPWNTNKLPKPEKPKA
jgi:hypothetical protein